MPKLRTAQHMTQHTTQHMTQRLQAAWLQRGALSNALLGFSWVYGALVALRRGLYSSGIFKSTRLPVKVVVVGNVMAGGAGKTPVVIEVVRHLQSQGWRVGVVSRGYGREGEHNPSALQVTSSTPAAQAGDEPALIHHTTQAPVFVAASRVAAAQALLAAYPATQVIVCDDGLQHLALQPDIEICVFDERGVGNGRLLPAGPLRESWPRKVDFILQTHADKPTAQPEGHASSRQASYVITRKLADHALRADGSRLPLSDLVALADASGQPVHALAGIAQPEVFFAMLRSAGLTLSDTTALPDHYNFNSELFNIHVGKMLICTHKDAVKLWVSHPHALAVPLVVDIPPSFYTALIDKLRQPQSH